METTTYACFHLDEARGGLPMLDYQIAIQEIETLVQNPWDYFLDVADVGVDPAYLYEMQRHPFPWFIELDALPTKGDMEEVKAEVEVEVEVG